MDTTNNNGNNTKKSSIFGNMAKGFLLKIIMYIALAVVLYFTTLWVWKKILQLFTDIKEGVITGVGIKPKDSCHQDKDRAAARGMTWCGDCNPDKVGKGRFKKYNDAYDRCLTETEAENEDEGNKCIEGFWHSERICDTSKNADDPESCMKCAYGWKRPTGLLSDWCCGKHENCNKIEVWEGDIWKDRDVDGDVGVDAGKNIVRPGRLVSGQLCDSRKDQGHLDSCLNCDNGFKKGIFGDEINDMCCNEDDRFCTQVIELKNANIGSDIYIPLNKNDNNYNQVNTGKNFNNFKKEFINKAGGDGLHSICDTRLDQDNANSCLNCEYGYRRPRGNLNDWCCRKDEFDNGICNDIERQESNQFTNDISWTNNNHNINSSNLPRYTNSKKRYSKTRAAEQFCKINNDQNDHEDCLNCEFGFYWNGANNICVKEEDKNDGGQWGVAKVGSGIGDFTTTSTFTKDNVYVVFPTGDSYNKDSKDFASFVFDGKNLVLKIRGDGFTKGRKYKLYNINLVNDFELPSNSTSTTSITVNSIEKYYKHAVPEKQCNKDYDRGHRESCMLCEYGSIFHGASGVGNDWCCSKTENDHGTCNAPEHNIRTGEIKYGFLHEGFLCDSSKEQNQPDSCKYCEHGAKRSWGSLNDHCCTADESGCFTGTPENIGNICDTRFTINRPDSCLNCKIGYNRNDPFNDKCCKDGEDCNNKIDRTDTDNPRFLVGADNWCSSNDNYPESCANCEYGFKYANWPIKDRKCCGSGDSSCSREPSDCKGTECPGVYSYAEEKSHCDSTNESNEENSCAYCQYGYKKGNPFTGGVGSIPYQDYCCTSSGAGSKNCNRM